MSSAGSKTFDALEKKKTEGKARLESAVKDLKEKQAKTQAEKEKAKKNKAERKALEKTAKAVGLSEELQQAKIQTEIARLKMEEAKCAQALVLYDLEATAAREKAKTVLQDLQNERELKAKADAAAAEAARAREQAKEALNCEQAKEALKAYDECQAKPEESAAEAVPEKEEKTSSDVVLELQQTLTKESEKAEEEAKEDAQKDATKEVEKSISKEPAEEQPARDTSKEDALKEELKEVLKTLKAKEDACMAAQLKVQEYKAKAEIAKFKEESQRKYYCHDLFDRFWYSIP